MKYLISGLRRAGLLAAALLVSACAIGNQYDYAGARTEITTATDTSVSVAVVDNRAYVLGGDKPPAFVGLQRGGFGNPFDVTTASEQALAADMTQALTRSLAARGIAAQALVVGHGTNNSAILEGFRGQGTERLLLVRMREWKTDAALRLTMHWDLDAAVYDSAGTVLGEHRISGVEPVGAARFESDNSVAAQRQFALKFAELVNHPDIAAALK